MSQQNNLSVEIPAATLSTCIGHAQAIATALEPYLQSLTDDDRRDLFKLGDKSVGYFQKLTGYIDTAPQHIPAFMDKAEFMKDAHVVIDLQPLYQVLSSLLRDIDDTRMLAGSEAMTGGKSYYGMVGLAAKSGAAGAQAIYDDLSERFPGRRGRSGSTAANQVEK